MVDPDGQISLKISGEYWLVYLKRDQPVHCFVDIRRIEVEVTSNHRLIKVRVELPRQLIWPRVQPNSAPRPTLRDPRQYRKIAAGIRTFRWTRQDPNHRPSVR